MSQTVINENNDSKNINEENKQQNEIKSKQLDKKALINIIDFELNPIEENKINSPRSLEAIAKLGYIFEDLIYNDFNQFKQIHYEIIPLELEMQQKRYNFYEDLRKTKIAEIKDLYIKLCNNENKKEINTMINNYSKKDYESTALKNNLITFEKIKAKNELDLINLANYEIGREIDQEFAMEKLRIQDEKREMIKKELKERREKEEDEKKIKFQEKINKMLEDSNNKLYQKQKELEIKDQERQKKIEENKMKKIIESLQRSIEKKELFEKNKHNLENQIQQMKELYEEKQKKKEIKQKEFEELKIKEHLKEKELSIKKEQEIKDVLLRNKKIEKKRINDYKEKQKQIELKRKEIKKNQNIENEIKIKENLEKEQHIKDILVKNEILEKEKKKKILKLINKKEENFLINHQRKINENILKAEESQEYRILKEEKIKALSRIQEYDRNQLYKNILEKSERLNELNLQKLKIIEKKKLMKDKILRKKEKYTEQFQLITSSKGFNLESIKFIEKIFPNNEKINQLIQKIKLKSQRNIFMNQNNLYSSRYNDKPYKSMSQSNFKVLSNYNKEKINMEKYKSHNSFFITSDNKNYLEDSKKKNNSLIKSKNNINDIDENNGKNNKQYNEKNIKNNNNNNKMNQLNEEEIKKQINLLRIKLNQDLMELISTEKQKEELREQTLINIKNQKEKKKLEKAFGLERFQASDKIIKKNEEIEKKIKQYELNLRNGKYKNIV